MGRVDQSFAQLDEGRELPIFPACKSLRSPLLSGLRDLVGRTCQIKRYIYVKPSACCTRNGYVRSDGGISHYPKYRGCLVSEQATPCG